MEELNIEKFEQLLELGNLPNIQDFVNSVEKGERERMLNFVDEDGRTALRVALTNADIAVVSWLLSQEEGGGRALGFSKIFPTEEEEDGLNPLLLAVTAGNLELFCAFVNGLRADNGERAEALNTTLEEGHSLLSFAAFLGHKNIVEWLLADDGGRAMGFENIGPQTLHAAIPNGGLAVFLAVVRGCKDEERLILLNTKNKLGCSVLQTAALHSHLSIVQWLLSSEEARDAGFSHDQLFSLTWLKDSVLHIAAGKGDWECFDAIVAACEGSAERLRLLLGVNAMGWTIFYYAARDGKTEFISHVLHKYPEESKIIINMRDNRGMTALHRTIIYGIDEKSRAEWAKTPKNAVAVIAALLENIPEAADPNSSLKFE